jgi:hypothetical protein
MTVSVKPIQDYKLMIRSMLKLRPCCRPCGMCKKNKLRDTVIQYKSSDCKVLQQILSTRSIEDTPTWHARQTVTECQHLLARMDKVGVDL